MQSESKPVVDSFLRRFKSMQEFDPFSQVPKLLKFTSDLVKVVAKLNKQLFAYTTSAKGSQVLAGSFANLPLQQQQTMMHASRNDN